MKNDEYRWFDIQRSFRQIRLFLIVFGVFVIAGVILAVSGLTGPGLMLAGMGLLFYALIVPQAAGWGRKYGIGKETLLLQTAFSKKILLFSEIRSAALLSKEESRRYMEELYYFSVESERQMDMSGWLKSNRRAGEVVRYLSVSVTGTEKRRGYTTNITEYSVRPDAELILLRTGGGNLLVSPVNTREYYNSLLAGGVAGVPVAAKEGCAVNSDIKRRGGGVRLAVKISSFVMLFAVAGIIIYFGIIPSLSNTGSSSAEPEAEAPGEEPGKALLCEWVDRHSFVFAAKASELSDIELNGGISAAMFTDYASPMIIKLLESDKEISAGLSGKPELIRYIGEFMMLHGRMTAAGEETSENGDLYLLYRVDMTELHDSLISLIRNSVYSGTRNPENAC